MKFARIARRSATSGRKPHQHRIKLILVKWEDATHQEDESEVPGTMIAWTMGFQVYRNEKEVSLCMETFEDGAKRNITTIPMGMVKLIKTLATIPMEVHD